MVVVKGDGGSLASIANDGDLRYNADKVIGMQVYMNAPVCLHRLRKDCFGYVAGYG